MGEEDEKGGVRFGGNAFSGLQEVERPSRVSGRSPSTHTSLLFFSSPLTDGGRPPAAFIGSPPPFAAL